MQKTPPAKTNWYHGYWMRMAARLATKCPPDAKAYSVGCVILDSCGRLLSTGHSREWGRCHAEESAITKVKDKSRLKGATIYCTMEPCTARDSAPIPCTDHIIKNGIKTVYIAVKEPANFKDCKGIEKLRAAGITVHFMPQFAPLALAPNRHIALKI